MHSLSYYKLNLKNSQNYVYIGLILRDFSFRVSLYSGVNAIHTTLLQIQCAMQLF